MGPPPTPVRSAKPTLPDANDQTIDELEIERLGVTDGTDHITITHRDRIALHPRALRDPAAPTATSTPLSPSPA
jgi:hypothetical protein